MGIAYTQAKETNWQIDTTASNSDVSSGPQKFKQASPKAGSVKLVISTIYHENTIACFFFLLRCIEMSWQQLELATQTSSK